MRIDGDVPIEIAVTIGNRDFEFAGDGPWPQVYGIDMKGLGVFLPVVPPA